MGTLHKLAQRESVTLRSATDAYLATLAGPESAGTRRVYSGILAALAARYGTDTDLTALQPETIAAWFASQWGERSPSRWNVALDALRSASRYWQEQGWLAEDPARMLRRRRKAPDHSRALSRADVERLLTREDISFRERTLWRLLYESAARSAGGATLHQLRHSALTHDAEDGASTPMLMAKSGHTSVASLARYARPSAEALARWQERNDPARRR
jgi:site-specific recombinase XerD